MMVVAQTIKGGRAIADLAPLTDDVSQVGSQLRPIVLLFLFALVLAVLLVRLGRTMSNELRAVIVLAVVIALTFATAGPAAAGGRPSPVSVTGTAGAAR